MTYRVLDLPVSERPREKMLKTTPEALSEAELLAIILGSGTPGDPVTTMAKQLLIRFGSLEKLADASIAELLEVRGIGEAKAVKLLAAFQLGKRVTAPQRRTPILTAPQAYEAMRPLFDQVKEERVGVALLDAKGGLIRTEIVSIGTVNRALLEPRDLFSPAIRHKALKIIVGHNHPSGDPTPSKADLEVTRGLLHAGEILGVGVVDHLIFGQTQYISIRQEAPDLWIERHTRQ